MRVVHRTARYCAFADIPFLPWVMYPRHVIPSRVILPSPQGSVRLCDSFCGLCK